MEPTVGTQLGNYRIVRLLGEGGMGRVFLAEHAVLGTTRAVKVLPAEMSRDAGLLSRFQDEARVMAHLEHPHIVRVHDTGVTDGVHYLVMDYVVGPGGAPRNLQQHLDEAPGGRVPQSQVFRWAVQLVHALEYAHGKGVIHRDIKPGNVLLDPQGHVRLADFGLVKMLGDGFLRTRFQQTLSHERTRFAGTGANTLNAAVTQGVPGKEAAMGTLDYMAPEQRDGRADGRSDVYAFGAMLYRMLTGRLPQGRFKLPTELLGHLSPEWDEVVDKCLATDPADRFATASELSAALAGLAAGAQHRKASAKKAEQQRLAAETEARRAAEESQRQPAEWSRRRANDPLTALAAPSPAIPEIESTIAKFKRGAAAATAVVLILGLFTLGLLLARGCGSKSSEPHSEPQYITNSIGMKLVSIPAGRFVMGGFGSDNEKPQREVTVSQSFHMGVYEVTQAQYREIMGSNPSRFGGDDSPVENVSWDDAVRFCEKLSAKEGKKYRLPTEAEWEYACRAGSTNDPPMSRELYDMGWHRDNSGGRTHTVGSKPPNGWGLHDLHGNVEEWCSDWYGANYYSQGVNTDPPGPTTGEFRVLRGGDIYTHLFSSSARRVLFASRRDGTVGFRVVLADS